MACSQSWPRLFARPGHEARTHRIRCKATIPSKDDGKQDDRKQTLQQIFAHQISDSSKKPREIARLYCLALPLCETRKPTEHNLV
jgi:hypothetical protein